MHGSLNQTAHGALRTRIDLGAADASELGLLIPHGTSFETWKTMGLRLGKKHKVLPWQIGDWAFRGSSEFGNAAVEEIAREAGFDLDEVRLFELVAGRFEMRRRRSRLTIHHHAQLALFGSDDVQDALLEQAEGEGLTVRQLKARLKERALLEDGGVRASSAQVEDVGVGNEPGPPSSENASLQSALDAMRLVITIEDVRAIQPRAEEQGLTCAQWLRSYLDEKVLETA